VIEYQEGYRELCENIDEYFQSSQRVLTKKRNIIKIINYQGSDLVVKSFKVPNLINKFAYKFIRDSKAKRSYHNGLRLFKLGIFNPKPIAYIEEFTPLLNRSFYICEKFDYDFEIRDVFKDESFENRWKILEEFAKFSFDLHQKGVYHIDYSPGNVLIKEEENSYQFALVDLNRIKFINFTDDLRFRNLSKLWANERDTMFLAQTYAKIADIDEEYAIKRLFYYHHRHQQNIKRKKKLKSKLP
jgi:serine/threonine protein kinase